MKKTDEIKMLCSLIKEGKATIEQEIRYNVLMIEILNPNTECGKRVIEKHIQELKRLNELKIELLNTNKKNVNEVAEAENNNVVVLEGRFVKRVSQVKGMKLKRGDVLEIIFNGESKSVGKILDIRFGQYYKSYNYDKEKEFKMYIEYKKENDNEIYVADIDKVANIEIISRSQRSKKILLSDNESLKKYIAYWGR
ncbi:hypothetical protein [Romboutsia sp.]|uniref:hypothetical protein n=1 Tax=Romboutsia sp. TaxID=1965302 RepID=UPI002C4B5683|nr:hypothetical protein [Romboutsia sp.]HSQ88723.1 hypothetical protein [Romboutsia sp.]